MRYASKSEAAYAAKLDAYQKAGEIVRWERQVRWPLVVNGVKVCTMVPDFRLWTDAKTFVLHEVKGHATAVYKLKRKLFEALHPDIPYIVIPAREALR